MSGSVITSRSLSFGAYPQRLAQSDAPALQAAWRALRSRVARPSAPGLAPAVAHALAAARRRLQATPNAPLAAEVDAVRAQLRQRNPGPLALPRALALASVAMTRTLGKTPYDTQLHAAWLILQGRLVEMATGEGKTLAAAIAAAVAALGGTPVHLLTANDYLVRRDRDSLAPFFDALGASSACVTAGATREQRIDAWRHDIVYSTARELAFDYLRDHVALRGSRDARLLRAQGLDVQESGAPQAAVVPVLPGLCCCIVDEADSILLDEAVVPLILCAPTRALDAAGYRRAFEVSTQLRRQRDYTLQPTRRSAQLTDAGRGRVATQVRGAGGVLTPTRRAFELVEAALAARLFYRRDREYVLQGAQSRIELIDELTGRIAEGRQWQGALHAMVEIKEGLAPSPPTVTAAQITYQRFFPRYLRLGGMSGTLLEARHELRVAYNGAAVRMALHRPGRRLMLGERCFVDAAHKWKAVLESVRAVAGAGRPVLVGTDSVADSAHLSALLHAAGIEHQLLNAVQDVDEADRVAHAGRAGMVTVATNIAGRGTDIALDASAAASGGLHVIATMRNRSRRVDRQLIGRCARHGDPGSAQTLLALDDTLLTRQWPAPVLRAAAALSSREGLVPSWCSRPLFAVAQRLAESRDRTQRRELRRADRWAAERFGFAGGTE
jgi:preprotein translocase subunit SecA